MKVSEIMTRDVRLIERPRPSGMLPCSWLRWTPASCRCARATGSA